MQRVIRLLATTQPATLKDFIDFVFGRPVWEKVVAGLIVALILGIVAWLRARRRRTTEQVAQTAGDSAQQAVISGSGREQTISQTGQQVTGAGGPVVYAAPGSTVNITVNTYDYQDGVGESKRPGVQESFNEGRAAAKKGDFEEAIRCFSRALDAETDHEKRGALRIQIGNAESRLRRHVKAAESYAAALREAEKANDEEGRGAALASIGNTYMDRPASTGEQRGQNVSKAAELYKKALNVITEDQYPVEFAATQNNLGAAYTDLPASDAAERAANVRKAIDCYNAALEIYKKDQYPVDFAMTQNNLGNAYTDLSEVRDKAPNLEKANAANTEALRVYT